MLNLSPKFVVDENEEKQAVLLTLDDWQRILEDLEELDDIREYDEAKTAIHDAVPFEQAVREITEAE